MGSELNCCGNFSRILLVIINFLFLALACTVLGIGIWLVVIGEDFSFITGSNLIGGAALLIIAGAVTLVICVIGILGAIFKWRLLLVVYAAVIAVIVVLEIVAGILGFVYSDFVVDTIDERAEEAIMRYRAPDSDDVDSSANNAVDAIQNTFDCCGYRAVEDWIRLNPTLVAANGENGVPPASCPLCMNFPPSECGNFTGTVNVTENGVTVPINIFFRTRNVTCRAAFTDRIVLIGSVAGGIGIVFGILEILGVILALGVCCCIHKAREQTVV